MPYFIIAMRSTPMPNANPLIFPRHAAIRWLSPHLHALLVHCLEHRRVHHPAAQQFNPPRMFALPAAFSAAEEMREIYIRARLRERKDDGKNLVLTPEPKNAFIA